MKNEHDISQSLRCLYRKTPR